MPPEDSLERCLHSELAALFSKYKSHDGFLGVLAKRNYVFAQPLQDKQVLFVGINPSFPKGACCKPYHYHPHPSKVCGKAHPHYRRFQKLADKVGISEDWAYADLFFLRETSQWQIERWMHMDHDRQFLSFLCDQLRLTMRLMEEVLKPRLIVVCNKMSHLFWGLHIKPTVVKKHPDDPDYSGVWMGYQLEKHADPDLGIHIVTGLHPHSIRERKRETSLIGTPIYFTSSLNYRTASSTDQLAAIIQRVLTR